MLIVRISLIRRRCSSKFSYISRVRPTDPMGPQDTMMCIPSQRLRRFSCKLLRYRHELLNSILNILSSASCPPCFLSTPLQAPALSKGTADLDSGNIPGPNAKLKLSSIPLGKRVIASQAPASTPSLCPGPGISTTYACGTVSLP
jgi:hypothetical protein